MSLALSLRRGALRIMLADDGRGLPSTADALGLRSLRERALLLGGVVAVKSAPRKGTRLIVELPLSGRP